MKKQYLVVLLICLILLTLSGCNTTGNEGESEIEKAVADFYQAGYDYEKIIETYDQDTDKYTKVILAGQVWQNPYKEHVKVDSYVLSKDGWVSQKVTQNRPYGYGKELQYQLDREETIDGEAVEVYTAEYTDNIAEAFQIQEDLTYTVKQEYYLDKDDGILVRVVTDLADMNKKVAIANDMSANGSTLAEAEKNSEQIAGLQQKEILNIYNYGNPTAITWPDFK
jgi:hypothetical protein